MGDHCREGALQGGKISSTAWMATTEMHGRKETQTHTGVLGGKVILGPGHYWKLRDTVEVSK